jgi:hypothetical protein
MFLCRGDLRAGQNIMVIAFPSWELFIAGSKKFFKANVLEF